MAGDRLPRCTYFLHVNFILDLNSARPRAPCPFSSPSLYLFSLHGGFLLVCGVICLLLHWRDWREHHYWRCRLPYWAGRNDTRADVAMKSFLALAAYGRPGKDLASRYHVGATNIHTRVAVVSSGLSARYAPSHAFYVWIVLCLVHASLVEKLDRGNTNWLCTA